MAVTRRTAMKAAAIAAAAESAIPGAVDAAPVDPIPEAVPSPPAIVEEVQPEERPNDLYEQIDKAYEDMEKGEEPIITPPAAIPGTKTEVPEQEIIEYEPPQIKAVKDETPEQEIIESEPHRIGAVKDETPKAETGTQIKGEKVEAPEPETPAVTGGGRRRSAIAAAKAAADKQAREDAKEDAKYGAQGTPSTGSTNPTVRPGYGKDKIADNANWGNEDQAKAVQAFLDEHPTGSPWGDDASYKNFAGCSAYAFQLMDIAYDGIDTTNHLVYIRDRSQIRQYDIINIGGHQVFVLEVLPEQNAVRTAEGNFNNKTFNEGVYSMDRIISILRPELTK